MRKEKEKGKVKVNPILGGLYQARVSGKLVPVKLLEREGDKWLAVNLSTDKLLKEFDTDRLIGNLEYEKLDNLQKLRFQWNTVRKDGEWVDVILSAEY